LASRNKNKKKVGMALIEKFEPEWLDKDEIDRPVRRAAYFTFEDKGKSYLKIRTFGSNERATIDHASQIIQLGPEAFAQLTRILAEV
jgi:hypothetical protein